MIAAALLYLVPPLLVYGALSYVWKGVAFWIVLVLIAVPLALIWREFALMRSPMFHGGWQDIFLVGWIVVMTFAVALALFSRVAGRRAALIVFGVVVALVLAGSAFSMLR